MAKEIAIGTIVIIVVALISVAAVWFSMKAPSAGLARAQCSRDSDCNDDNECTLDRCTGHTCNYEKLDLPTQCAKGLCVKGVCTPPCSALQSVIGTVGEVTSCTGSWNPNTGRWEGTAIIEGKD